MDISEKISTLVDRFTRHDDWEDRYRELIKEGKGLVAMDVNDQQDKFKIKGCQSQVWLRPNLKDGKVYFIADSDAVLVKGIIALLLAVYSGEAPEVIMKTKPNFLGEIGITEHLSMNRTNGLASMVKQIHLYAMVFDNLVKRGVLNADNL